MAITKTPVPVGVRYGYLTVLGEGAPHYSQRSAGRGLKQRTVAERTFRVVCDCGEEATILASNVRNGRTTTCGKHGHGSRRGYSPLFPLGYKTVHAHVRRARGSASGYACTACGATAKDWAYNNSCAEEVQSWSRDDNCVLRYCEHMEHYAPMCRKCHKAMDVQERKVRNDQV